jgi:RecA-family ATPase
MFCVYPAPLNLLRDNEMRELCAMADGMALVVIDTVNRCAVGGDENSARDMGIFVDAAYKVREATGDGIVLALHHTGKDKATIRGSSALEAGVDCIYQTEGDHVGITLKRTKRKDGPPDDGTSSG